MRPVAVRNARHLRHDVRIAFIHSPRRSDEISVCCVSLAFRRQFAVTVHNLRSRGREQDTGPEAEEEHPFAWRDGWQRMATEATLR